ncbi:hypothetical protein E2562_014465 [Oryza meyeriana var. granulata]|uniref:Uncharacterized protein n=1 Tax=Oryza meyeriana var. granulata TaxID=110450 RepID=A0A6G1CPZ1_9ORYZ|nr:hypothetical protein E2562_014465 [Oryza meyeriana var. granulata]
MRAEQEIGRRRGRGGEDGTRRLPWASAMPAIVGVHALMAPPLELRRRRQQPNTCARVERRGGWRWRTGGDRRQRLASSRWLLGSCI